MIVVYDIDKLLELKAIRQEERIREWVKNKDKEDVWMVKGNENNKAI